jgi:hypothetical protein
VRRCRIPYVVGRYSIIVRGGSLTSLLVGTKVILFTFLTYTVPKGVLPFDENLFDVSAWIVLSRFLFRNNNNFNSSKQSDAANNHVYIDFGAVGACGIKRDAMQITYSRLVQLLHYETRLYHVRMKQFGDGLPANAIIAWSDSCIARSSVFFIMHACMRARTHARTHARMQKGRQVRFVFA